MTPGKHPPSQQQHTHSLGELQDRIKKDLGKLKRLQEVAAQTRLRAIEIQLATGSTFCALAETAPQYTYDLTGRIRRIIAMVDRHLGEPGHVPESSLPQVRSKLACLESRLLRIENATDVVLVDNAARHK